MLLYIDKTFTQDILDNNQIAISAINLIALGRRQGKHLLLSDLTSLKRIRDSDFINEETKRVFTFLSENYPNYAAIKDKLTFYIQITSGINQMTLKNIDSKDICFVSCDYFQDLKIAAETVVIGENQSEIDFYEYIANSCKAINGLSKIPLAYQPRMGGGHTTHVVYSTEQNQEKTFCLCFVDSDKKYPGARLGDTLKAVAEADDKTKLLSQYHPLNVREIENIIPLNILEKVSHDDANYKLGYESLEKTIKSENCKDVLFLDIKKGLSIKKYKSIKDENFKEFINSICIAILSFTKDELDTFFEIENEEDIDTKVLIQGLGTNVLERTIDHLNKNTEIVPVFDFEEQKKEWYEIGEKFINWTCSGHRIL